MDEAWDRIWKRTVCTPQPALLHVRRVLFAAAEMPDGRIGASFAPEDVMARFQIFFFLLQADY